MPGRRFLDGILCVKSRLSAIAEYLEFLSFYRMGSNYRRLALEYVMELSECKYMWLGFDF